MEKLQWKNKSNQNHLFDDALRALFLQYILKLDTRVIEKLQLYKYMGFTENWFDIDACAKTGEKKISE